MPEIGHSDAYLRRFGYVLHSRPTVGEPLWRREGRIVTQEQALLEIARRIKEVATQK
jgi:hypothetical protein